MRRSLRSQAGRRPPLSAHRNESRHSKPPRFLATAQESEDPELAKKKSRVKVLREKLRQPGATQLPDFDRLLQEFDLLKEQIGEAESEA